MVSNQSTRAAEPLLSAGCVDNYTQAPEFNGVKMKGGKKVVRVKDSGLAEKCSQKGGSLVGGLRCGLLWKKLNVFSNGGEEIW